MLIRNILALSLAAGLAAACQQAGSGNDTEQANRTGSAGGGDGNTQAPGQANRTIAESASQAADHSTFVRAVEAAGLTETLRGAGPYTVFAPANAAFERIPEQQRNAMMEASQRERLIGLLSYHIVPGTVTSEDLRRAIQQGQGGRAELATVAGGNLTVMRDGDAIVITDGAGGRARVTRADQLQSNGVLHSIDAVLMPAGG
jgi:uncharacterized surface protein with fasciclin (FAS1) repeats